MGYGPYFNITHFTFRSCHSSRNAKKYYNKRKPSGGPGVPASEPSKEKKPRREANGDGQSRKPKGKARAAKAK
jgi:hypothetical protein